MTAGDLAGTDLLAILERVVERRCRGEKPGVGRCAGTARVVLSSNCQNCAYEHE